MGRSVHQVDNAVQNARVRRTQQGVPTPCRKLWVPRGQHPAASGCL